jgi:hypothetical protein
MEVMEASQVILHSHKTGDLRHAGYLNRGISKKSIALFNPAERVLKA